MAVARLIKLAALDAGLDPDRYSGHSRAPGSMRQTRHKSTGVALGYLRRADLWRNNVTERVFREGGRK
jgi:hypothetical protein